MTCVLRALVHVLGASLSPDGTVSHLLVRFELDFPPYELFDEVAR
jgi:hypothetical protein